MCRHMSLAMLINCQRGAKVFRTPSIRGSSCCRHCSTLPLLSPSLKNSHSSSFCNRLFRATQLLHGFCWKRTFFCASVGQR